jgi:hypothetical protein
LRGLDRTLPDLESVTSSVGEILDK